MKINAQKNIRLLWLCVFFFISCNHTNEKNNTIGAATPQGLNSVITKLPESPGYKTFQQNCMSCHSARYVQMQPALSENTWTALVVKMQKTFGAPVPDSAVKEIVQYLVTIKGKS